MKKTVTLKQTFTLKVDVLMDESTHQYMQEDRFDIIPTLLVKFGTITDSILQQTTTPKTNEPENFRVHVDEIFKLKSSKCQKQVTND